MNKIKLMCLISTLTMTCTIFSACGSKSDNKPNNETTTEIVSETTINQNEETTSQLQEQNGATTTTKTVPQGNSGSDTKSAQNNNSDNLTEPQATVPQPYRPTTTKPIATKPTTTKPATTKPTTAPTQPSQNDLSGFEYEMLNLVNQQRANEGLPTLSLDTTLCSNAQVRAEEISTSQENFAHTRPDGSQCFTAITINYSTAGENIAYGQPSVSAVVDAWMNSPGHRANIMSTSFTKAGFGCYEKNGVKYWSQFFVG